MRASFDPRRSRRALPAVALIAMIVTPGSAPGAETKPSAESLFVAGHFEAADSAFARRLRDDGRDTLALSRRGQIALLHNRTGEARDWLERARRAGARSGRVSTAIGETYYREGKLVLAAAAFERAGRTSFAGKLAALGDGAYRITGPERTAVRFAQTDPLPVVELEVNGRGPLSFILDTGGGELLLDPDLADTLGAHRFGEEMGTYAADQRRATIHATVDSVRLGAFTLHRVPVTLLPTSRFNAVAGGRRVAGVLGTTLLSRFRFTVDYPAGELLVERLGATSPPGADSGVVEVPLWWARDHFLLVRGTLGSSGPLLWFLDTGLAGAAFTAPASTLVEAGVALKDTIAFTGQGGAGAVRVVPFRVPRLSVGAAAEEGLLGMLGPFPSSLEYSLGPRVAGIVSHAFLRPYRVTFDLQRMRLTLARPAKP